MAIQICFRRGLVLILIVTSFSLGASTSQKNEERVFKNVTFKTKSGSGKKLFQKNYISCQAKEGNNLQVGSKKRSIVSLDEQETESTILNGKNTMLSFGHNLKDSIELQKNMQYVITLRK
jgi:hypothetical protein